MAAAAVAATVAAKKGTALDAFLKRHGDNVVGGVFKLRGQNEELQENDLAHEGFGTVEDKYAEQPLSKIQSMLFALEHRVARLHHPSVPPSFLLSLLLLLSPLPFSFPPRLFDFLPLCRAMLASRWTFLRETENLSSIAVGYLPCQPGGKDIKHHIRSETVQLIQDLNVAKVMLS